MSEALAKRVKSIDNIEILKDFRVDKLLKQKDLSINKII